ncbi:winged helix-turn-helix domain-containing protein [Pantoea septica]|uniref:winged helix-turn-helix domain-containing protein n=1 Tax=Pantoea septica TaxID=472695 RepID=UPI00289ACF66|nr:winged helix-turn-helix domain-containing protein [Pantoea septica]
MIYIIDGSVSYNSDDCSLNHLPTQESLSLSISSGRLLERLLNSEGEILPRDVLLTEVWDKYGLRGSNSNLNQYLSMLRRALAAFGCENLIITIPKVGISLNNEIPIWCEIAHPEIWPDPSTALPAKPVRERRQVLQPPQKLTKSPWLFKASLLLFLLFLTAWAYLRPDPSEQELSPVLLSLPGGCRAVFVNGLGVGERESIKKQILQMLKENHQPCDASRRIYFNKKTSFNAQNYGRTMLSTCKLNDSSHVISCDNFYYIDWRPD